MQRIQAAVHSHLNMFVLADITVDSKAFQSFGQFRVVGGHHSTIACSAEIFRREKAEATNRSQNTSSSALVFSTDRLTGIFDNLQVVLLGDPPKAFHIAALPEEMHGHDRFGSRCNRIFNGIGVEIKRFGVDVDKNRCRTSPTDRTCSGEE